MVLYPTEEWLVEYRHRINEHDGLDGLATTVTGNFLFVITDIPLDETTLRDLPAAAFDGLPRNVRRPLSLFALDGLVRPFVRPFFSTAHCFGSPLSLSGAATLFRSEWRGFLPERTADLLRQIDEHVVDDSIYAFISLENGNCTEVGILDGPDERAVDVVLRGPNGTWGEIIDGDRSVFSAIDSGDFEVGGDAGTERLAQYASAMELLGEAAVNVETVRLF